MVGSSALYCGIYNLLLGLSNKAGNCSKTFDLIPHNKKGKSGLKVAPLCNLFIRQALIPEWLAHQSVSPSRVYGWPGKPHSHYLALQNIQMDWWIYTVDIPCIYLLFSSKSPHKRHCISHLWRPDMWCLLCIQNLTTKVHLTLKHRETHGCVVSTVATDALVLKHQAISILSTD